MSPFGILNINKPAGLTSRRVVDRVAGLVQPEKAGHAGTLDPLATGVLVLCVGRATRLISYVQERRKEYRATFLLGRRSNTDDVTGDLVDVPMDAPVTRAQIEELLPRFTGDIEQVPPQFSAVHVNGRRAYKLARKGQSVEIAPRTVTVDRCRLTGFAETEFELDVECGSGTYIRSIGRDIGELLGCGAVMSELVRTRIGVYPLETAVELDALTPESLAEALLPPLTAVEHLPQFECSGPQLREFTFGRTVRWDESVILSDGAMVAATTPQHDLACLARYTAADGLLAPKHVFVEPAS